MAETQTTSTKRPRVKLEAFDSLDELKQNPPHNEDYVAYTATKDGKTRYLWCRDHSHALELIARIDKYEVDPVEGGKVNLEDRLGKMDEDQLNALFKKVRKQKKEKEKEAVSA